MIYKSWNVSEEVAYYEKQPERYSVVYAYINASAHNQNYQEMLDNIKPYIELSNKWILMQKININSGDFLFYFIELSKSGKQIIYLNAGCSGNEKIYKMNDTIYPDKDSLMNLIFKKPYNGLIDISNYAFDGTMYYITALDEKNIYRKAIYNPKIKKKGGDIIKIVELIEGIQY